MARRNESDYREVVFEREGKEPLRLASSPPEFIARLLLSEWEKLARREADQETEATEENRSWYSRRKARTYRGRRNRARLAVDRVRGIRSGKGELAVSFH